VAWATSELAPWASEVPVPSAAEGGTAPEPSLDATPRPSPAALDGRRLGEQEAPHQRCPARAWRWEHCAPLSPGVPARDYWRAQSAPHQQRGRGRRETRPRALTALPLTLPLPLPSPLPLLPQTASRQHEVEA